MNRKRLNRFEWASNQSIAVWGSKKKKSRPASRPMSAHLCTRPHMRPPAGYECITFLDRHSCAIRKFSVWVCVVFFGRFIINLKLSMNNKREISETYSGSWFWFFLFFPAIFYRLNFFIYFFFYCNLECFDIFTPHNYSMNRQNNQKMKIIITCSPNLLWVHPSGCVKEFR